MRWKPSRSSGLMFDKFDRKARENQKEVARMIETNEYLHYDKLNRFSKAIYLYWLNLNKKHAALTGRKSVNSYSLDVCCINSVIYKMLLRNKEHVYKPFAKILSNTNLLT